MVKTIKNLTIMLNRHILYLMRLETVFQNELRDSFRYLYPNGFWLKIPDGIAVGETRFIPEKPFDIIAIVSGLTMALELKAHKKHTAWPVSSLRPSQIEGLRASKLAGAVSYVVILVRYKEQFRKINFAAFIDIDNLPDTKSITVADLRKYPHIVRQKVDGKTIWDLRFIKNYLTSQADATQQLLAI